MHRGAFLKHDISEFDPSFFGISPRDAENMDPQQRTLLEVVWESFENAGLSLPQHSGKNVGVYVGGFMLDHMINQMSPGNRSIINQHTATGMMMSDSRRWGTPAAATPRMAPVSSSDARPTTAVTAA